MDSLSDLDKQIEKQKAKIEKHDLKSKQVRDTLVQELKRLKKAKTKENEKDTITKWRSKNKDKVNEMSRRYYHKNKENLSKKIKEYREANRELLKERYAKSAALKLEKKREEQRIAREELSRKTIEVLLNQHKGNL